MEFTDDSSIDNEVNQPTDAENDCFDDGMDNFIAQVAEESSANPSHPVLDLPTNSAKRKIAFFMTQTEKVKDSSPVKRAFPGPAGNLKPLDEEAKKRLETEPSPFCLKVLKKVKKSYSKTSDEVDKLEISKAPWRSLLQILDLNLKDSKSLLHLLNIRWILSNVMYYEEDIKVPFLVAVVLEKFDEVFKVKSVSKNITYNLMDSSGTILAVCSSSFAEPFEAIMIPGTAIALQNCGISKFGKQVQLTVSRDSVLYVVTGKDLDDQDVKTLTSVENGRFPIYKRENEQTVIQMATYNKETILKEYRFLVDKIKSSDEEKQSKIQGKNVEDPSGASGTSISNFYVDCSQIFDDDDFNDFV